MRRHTVRIVKYVLIGGVILVLGPLLLRNLLGGKKPNVETFVDANDHRGESHIQVNKDISDYDLF